MLNGRFTMALAAMAMAAVLACGGCEQPRSAAPDPAAAKPATTKAATTQPAATSPPATRLADDGGPSPCIAGSAGPADANAVPRYVEGSPFGTDYKPPAAREGKRLWAKSALWSEAPKLIVEKWLTDEPQTKGKYVLIEFWATWCPPCRRSINLLNELHRKHNKELVVIGISHEDAQAVRRLVKPKIEYFSAIDTKSRTKNVLGVFGIPHVVIIEPGGCVVWEGFPLQAGYELTDKVVERILAVGRKQRAEATAKP